MKREILIIAICTFYSASFAQNQWFQLFPDSTSLNAAGDQLIEEFQQSIWEVDKTIDLKSPQTHFNPMGPFYLSGNNSVNLPVWNLIPDWYRDFCVNLMGTEEGGKELFAHFFNGFYVPHELGHALQKTTNKWSDNSYDNEYIANIIGLLYWKKQGKDKELAKCYEFVKRVLPQLPNPIPEGEDVKSYFTEHYREFTQDFSKYGYMQFSQYRKVYEDTNLPDFNSYINEFLDSTPEQMEKYNK